MADSYMCVCICIQHVFIEHLLCVKHCANCWGYNDKEERHGLVDKLGLLANTNNTNTVLSLGFSIGLVVSS